MSSGNLRTLSLCGCQQLSAVHLVRLPYPYSYPLSLTPNPYPYP